jgi:magnesium chelatase subunit D
VTAPRDASTRAPAAFPFSAIVGQGDLREALLACAVEPAIGGVLVRGERGTAKTTAVRGLAPLLPPIRVREGDRYSADPDGEPSPDGGGAVAERPVRLVELPVGATADRVLGTLDLERALTEGAHAFQPGLLAAAHRGILYVDEVNLLPDHLVDVLLDAAALGRNHVERDGLSVAHAAQFLLVGTMNPEEGDLRPQLLDRFGLSVEVAGDPDPAVRVEIVRRRLAFDADPPAFAARFAADERELAARVAAARERLADVRLADRTLLLIAGLCARLGVDGHRADIVCARAARALAALDGADEVDRDHVRRAARLALAHRRRRGPLQEPGLDDAELDAALDESDDPEPDPSPNGTPPRGGAPTSANGASREAPAEGAPASRGSAPADSAPREAPAADEERPYRAEAPAVPRNDPPTPAGRAPLLALAGVGRGASGRRSRAAGGPPVDSREPAGAVVDLAAAAPLRAATARRAIASGPPLASSDLREHVRAGREGNLVVFCVDASGSMGARRRMARVKGAILGLLTDAYQRRDRVALITFRGDRAELVLPPTGSVERAARHLAALPTGGRTPLAAGLAEAERLIRAEARRDPTRRALAVVVTDGRAAQRTEALAAAHRLGRAAAGVIVFDGEQGPVRLGLAGALAEAAGGRLLPLSALEAA